MGIIDFLIIEAKRMSKRAKPAFGPSRSSTGAIKLGKSRGTPAFKRSFTADRLSACNYYTDQSRRGAASSNNNTIEILCANADVLLLLIASRNCIQRPFPFIQLGLIKSSFNWPAAGRQLPVLQRMNPTNATVITIGRVFGTE